jgi:hypothetical protein
MESMIEFVGTTPATLKLADETMALRWCAASMVEAGKQCRRSTVLMIIGPHADNPRSQGYFPMWPIRAL